MTKSRLSHLGAGVAGAAAIITVLTLAARLVGFGRWFAQNAWIGPNEVGAAYSTANTVPNVLFEVAAGGALAGAVIPLLAAPIAAHLRKDVDRSASALLTWAVVVLAPVAALTWLLAPAIVELLLDGSRATDPAQVDLASTLLRMFAIQIPLYGVGVVLTGVLQAHRRFVAPALAPLLSSLVVLGSYYAFGLLAPTDPAPGELTRAAVAWLGWGTTAGVVVLSLPLLIPVARAGVRLRPTLHVPDGVARRAWALALAGMGTLVAQQISVLVAVRLANQYGDSNGTINVHQYAQAVVLLPYAVLAVPLATAMFPRLAHFAATGRRQDLARESATSTRVILVVAAVGAGVLVAVARPVEAVFAAFARGGVVDGMAGAMTASAASVIGLALVFHLSRVLYALERARLAVAAASVGWVAVAVVSIATVLITVPAGGDGPTTLRALGLGTSVGTLIGAGALLYGVRRSLGGEAISGVPQTGVVAIIGAVLGALAGRGLETLFPSGGVAATIGYAVIVALVASLITLAVVLVGDRASLLALRRSRGSSASSTEGAGIDGPIDVDENEGQQR